MPFLVNSVGWMITRFQPRSHGGSSYRLIFGREYSGEIAEMGEQLWYRLAARVSAGPGNWEARFARGIWVGKSEIDDTQLVVDLERWISEGQNSAKDAKGISLECRDASRHSVHTLETHTGELCTS